MIRTFYRLRPASLSYLQRRTLSAKAIYSSFPASLAYYRPQQKSNLFDHKELDSRPDDLYNECVVVAGEGLVFPGINKQSVSNGAIMFPNTFMMQEYVRRYFDEFLDRKEGGEEVETPWIYTIPKGTPIPSHLILINEFIARFSLQPSRGMLLQDLNRYLDEFFDTYAVKEKVEDWLDKHPFQSATSDGVDTTWMAK